jgi:hypothetical protein
MPTLIVALLLLPLALGLLLGLVALLARPLIGPALAAVERARFHRCLARCARADAQLEARRIDAALHELEAAFCLQTVRADAALADQIVRHHVGLLSRLLSVLDDLPHERVRLLALAKVDRLIERRRETQHAYLQLRNRPWRDGRRLQLGGELKRNARATRAAVRELIADIQLLSTRRVAVQ